MPVLFWKILFWEFMPRIDFRTLKTLIERASVKTYRHLELLKTLCTGVITFFVITASRGMWKRKQIPFTSFLKSYKSKRQRLSITRKACCGSAGALRRMTEHLSLMRYSWVHNSIITPFYGSHLSRKLSFADTVSHCVIRLECYCKKFVNIKVEFELLLFNSVWIFCRSFAK